jgi:hypothetical protein
MGTRPTVQVQPSHRPQPGERDDQVPPLRRDRRCCAGRRCGMRRHETAPLSAIVWHHGERPAPVSEAAPGAPRTALAADGGPGLMTGGAPCRAALSSSP